MNFVEYMKIYTSIKKLQNTARGRYSFGPYQISYAYTIPVDEQYVNATKTMHNGHGFSYLMTVTGKNGQTVYTVHGTRAERIFKLLLNKEHTR